MPKIVAIRSDEDVIAEIAKRGKFGESHNDVLRRILGLEQVERSKPGRPRNEPTVTTNVPTKRAR